MAIADIILARIADAGFAVRVEPTVVGSSTGSSVRAIDLATGRVWRATGPTLIDAAENLLQQLHDYHEGLSRPPVSTKYGVAGSAYPSILERDPASVVLVIGLVAAIFILDLATPGINLGIFFLIPLWLTYHRRFTPKWIAPLAIVMVTLIFLDQVLMEGIGNGAFRQEPAGILNRCFAVLAITASAVVIKLMLAWKSRSSNRSDIHPREGTPSMALPVHRGFAKSGSWVAWVLGMFVVATFIADLTTPVAANCPIFYLIPTALVASTHRRLTIWGLGGVLLLLIVSGYLMSPRGELVAADMPLVVMNRIVTCSGLALVAIVCHLAKSEHAGHNSAAVVG